MISAFYNLLKIPELRRRILYTSMVVIVIRLGAIVTLPGVNSNVLQQWIQQWIQQMANNSSNRGEIAMLALLNVLSGGGLQNAALFALVPPTAAQFFEGTCLLIIVGVILDVTRKVETHLIQRYYEGFLRNGRIKGCFDQKATFRSRLAG